MVGVREDRTIACSGKVILKAFTMNEVRQKKWRAFNHGRRWRVKTWDLQLEVQGVLTYNNLDRDPVRPDMA